MTRLIIYGILAAVVFAALAGVYFGIRHQGALAERAEWLAQVKEHCGENAKTPKDCFDSGVNSVKVEFTGKINAANVTIESQSAAIVATNASIERLKADSTKRIAAAEKARVEMQKQVQALGAQIEAIAMAQPTIPGDLCRSSCVLIQSFSP